MENFQDIIVDLACLFPHDYITKITDTDFKGKEKPILELMQRARNFLVDQAVHSQKFRTTPEPKNS